MKKLFMKIIVFELAILARWVYRRFRPYVIGITGSSGKTTTKYMTGMLLGYVRKSTRVSRGNLNTQTGLPLAVLGYTKGMKNIFDFIKIFFASPFVALCTRSYADYLVLEYAADRPGDIKKLTKIIAPDIAVITNIGVAHLEKYENIGKIAEEKWELALAAKEKVICGEETINKIKGLKQPNAEVAIAGNQETCLAKNIKKQTNKTLFDLNLFSKSYQTSFSFMGEHNLENLEMAVLAACFASGETKKIVENIKNLEPQKGRGRRVFGKNDVLIFDESYNANPASMLSALKNLEETHYGRRVAILGQMTEIGSISSRAHREICNYAKKVADFTIGVGEGFKECDLDKWYPNVEELKGEVKDLLNRGDAVLIKGSHSNKLEGLVGVLQ